MPTAFTATFGSGKPVIVIMGEFDALPGLSQKDVPSLTPVQAGAPGHGCGHNLLGSASALAAVAIKEDNAGARLKRHAPPLRGRPPKKAGGGKIWHDPRRACSKMSTRSSLNPGDSNRVNMSSLLANNGGRFKFYGVAPPRRRRARSCDAPRTDGVMIMLNAAEYLREHVPQETRIHYIITNGGSAPNIVPAFAEANLVARNPDAQVLAGIWDRIMDCARAGALASGTRMEFEQGTTYANPVPNDALTEVLGRAMQKAGGYEYTPDEKSFAVELQKTLGGPVRSPGPEKVRTDMSEGFTSASSDSGDVSWVVPTAQFSAATFVPGVSAHTWQAAACAGTSIGRKGMVVAARTLAVAGVELFENPLELKTARDAFEKRLDGRKWTTRIAPDSKPPLYYATK